MAILSSPHPKIDVEDFAFQHSSPHSLRQPFSSPPAPPLVNHDYNFCPDVYNESTSATDLDDNAPAEDDPAHLSADDRRISGHSSISSFPASISHHAIPIEPPRTPSRSPMVGTSQSRAGSQGSKIVSPRAGREYNSAFRNPSSVVAMQMRDEDGDGIMHHHRRSGSAMSGRSLRSSYSTHSSPTKRLSRSSQSSPQKGSKLKKEFPLVLLHCTLLPAARNINPSVYDDELFGALLPEEYRKRWIALQDRLANTEVKTRGVLIPHPKEDYELLEERLLESLELEKPRIRQSHFFKHSGNSGDSGFESASQTEDDSDSDVHDGIKCPDCGRKVRDGEDLDRKWEVKVYAANGLMRAGAWNAAWREMEKVDVEIGLWMPEDLRRDVNAKLEAIAASEHESQHLQPEDEVRDTDAARGYDARESEIYGNSSRSRAQDEIDGLVEEMERPQSAHPAHRSHEQMQPDLPLLVMNYLKVISSDWRNVFMVLLGMIAVLYAVIGGTPGQGDSTPAPMQQSKSAEVLTTTITSTAVWTSTMTASQVLGTPVVSASTTFTQSSFDAGLDVEEHDGSGAEDDQQAVEILSEAEGASLEQGQAHELH